MRKIDGFQKNLTAILSQKGSPVKTPLKYNMQRNVYRNVRIDQDLFVDATFVFRHSFYF